MPADVVETAKIFASLVGAGMGAVGGVSIKEYLDRRGLREKEYQTRWLPLYRAAQDLKERLQCLTSIYKTRPLKYQWNNYTYGDNEPFPLEARDFHELYLLNKDSAPIPTFIDLPDPGERREDKQAVQKVRERIHELNRATISLYRMARYLGYAQRVLSELTLGQLKIASGLNDTKDSLGAGLCAMVRRCGRMLRSGSGRGIGSGLKRC